MSASRVGLRAAAGALRGRGIEIFTVLALAAGSLLIVADVLTLFRIETRGLVADTQAGGTHHAYAMAFIGAAVIGATLLARSAEQWPPALAVVVLGLVSVVIVLTLDRPDATRSDLLTSARVGDAEPAIGFWLELAGAVMSVVAGAALAFCLRASPRR